MSLDLSKSFNFRTKGPVSKKTMVDVGGRMGGREFFVDVFPGDFFSFHSNLNFVSRIQLNLRLRLQPRKIRGTGKNRKTFFGEAGNNFKQVFLQGVRYRCSGLGGSTGKAPEIKATQADCSEFDSLSRHKVVRKIVVMLRNMEKR